MDFKRFPSRRHTKGFATAMAAIIGVVVLITFTAIYKRINIASRQNVILKQKDASLLMAENGLAKTINRIRTNPRFDAWDAPVEIRHKLPKPRYNLYRIMDPELAYLEETPHRDPEYIEDIKDDKEKVIGQFKSYGTTVTVDGVFDTPVYQLITEGWTVKPNGDKGDRARMHVYVEMANVGDYLMAVKGNLTIAGGANFGSNGNVYGDTLTFDWTEKIDPITIGRADYENVYNFTPDPPPSADALVINGVPGAVPTEVENPLIFPSIDDDLLYYRSIPHPNDANKILTPYVCDFRADEVLLPPAIETDYGVGDPGTHPDNLGSNHGYPEYHYYYCPHDVYIGTLTVHGQVVIVTPKRIVVTGDILVADETSCKGNPDCTEFTYNFKAGDPHSTAHQLVLIAKEGIHIHQDWCQSDLDGDFNRLNLNAMLLVPTNTILEIPGYLNSETNPNCFPKDPDSDKDPPIHSLKFKGAMYLGVEPGLAQPFNKGREYRFNETFLSDPPPLRLTAHRVWEYEFLYTDFALVE